MNNTVIIVIVIVIILALGYFLLVDKFNPMSVEDRWKFSIKDNSSLWNLPNIGFLKG
jgi:hypothetical protein